MEENKQITVSAPSNTGIDIFGSIEHFEAGQRMAKLFAASTLVPKQYQNNVGNCVIALNMAVRMKSDPLMLMQNLVIVHNVPTFEAKFAIACFNATEKYSPIRYREVGEKGKDSWGYYAYAIEKATGEVCTGPEVTIAIAKAEGWYTQNPKWKNVPDLMLRYRAASWFIRTTDPGVMMGFQTKEEMEDFVDYEEVKDEATTEQPNVEEEIVETEEETTEVITMEDKSEEAAPKEEKPKKKEEPIGKQEVPDMFK